MGASALVLSLVLVFVWAVGLMPNGMRPFKVGGALFFVGLALGPRTLARLFRKYDPENPPVFRRRGTLLPLGVAVLYLTEAAGYWDE